MPAGPPDPNGLGVAASRLSNSARKSGRVPLLIAAALLDEGESVECVVCGRFEGQTAVAALTSKRLLIVNEQAWRPSVVRVEVDQGMAVQGWQDERTASLTFSADGRQMVVEQIADRPLAVEMAGRIRARSTTR